MSNSKIGTKLCEHTWKNNLEIPDENGDLKFIRVANTKLCQHSHCTFAHDDTSRVFQCRAGSHCDEKLCMYLHANDVLVPSCVQHPKIRYFKEDGEVSEKIFNEAGEVITTHNYDRSFPKKVAAKVPEVALQSTKGWGDRMEVAVEEEDAFARFKKAKEEAQKAETALQNSLKAMEARSSKIDSQIEDLKKEKTTLDKKMQEIREQLKKD